MKLATLNNGTRDGQLVVVSRDLTLCVAVPEIARTLQQALDNWDAVVASLQDVYFALNERTITARLFDAEQCLSPLPRSYHWADGSAYVNHVELVRKARGAEMPASFWTDPLMYQGGSDTFLAPRSPILMADEAWGIDFEAEVAVVTADVAMGSSVQEAAQAIRLLMLVNDVSLRGLIPNELAKGFGFYQSKPSSAFSPVAVTPDELGEEWDGARLALPLRTTYNHELFGCPNAGVDMTFSFPELIAHAAKTRALCAGSIIGSGTVSNKQGTDYGSAIREGGVGYSCIAELRMIETLRDGEPKTAFMRFGDSVRIEMLNSEQQSIFGAIEQQVMQYNKEV
ncbi:fumarylacetoacetate hydrolase family protein [Vibrio cholerae]|uniref:fumarylacetoacetate hydrolase family protein n=1 Tax=Vibrio cholerae TaxID=666 RepID=UPI001A9CC7D7|nr:fumarylacetoacetate hydrolase family protein [Vibrio cholerae]EGR3862956.1 FAA hydrolase family protein [Vibrio cholerae]EJK2280928.1 fumarylacetoacetate hydrolase family protein [Vibrio cholerae]EJL6340120.1 fumarylacetoacetate hydrolase family protein [Vibrio cholerae]EJL6760391.1 fumarylacetoacetate hydrolase family protein [Vibrio cholerae]MBO1380804.1 2-keto-4-pentenoate hydratase [Vibrio cholerae]